MSCQQNDKTLFKDVQAFTVQCEACGLFAKMNHYRSCQQRIQWNIDNGNEDILKPIVESNRTAIAQTGKSIEPVNGIPALGIPTTSKDTSGNVQITARERKTLRRDRRKGRG
jgi:hypothetical protein